MLKKIDYDQVFSQSKKVVTPEFIVLYCNNTIGNARLGLAISKKMVAKAHDRNRVKRLLRETFRTRTLPFIDIVVLAKRGVAKVSNSTLVCNLEKALDKMSS